MSASARALSGHAFVLHSTGDLSFQSSTGQPFTGHFHAWLRCDDLIWVTQQGAGGDPFTQIFARAQNASRKRRLLLTRLSLLLVIRKLTETRLRQRDDYSTVGQISRNFLTPVINRDRLSSSGSGLDKPVYPQAG